MRVSSRFLSHLRLDQTYCLLSARNVSVLLEFFRAIDVRGEMALDGMDRPQRSHTSRVLSGCLTCINSCRRPVLCVHASRDGSEQGQDLRGV